MLKKKCFVSIINLVKFENLSKTIFMKRLYFPLFNKISNFQCYWNESMKVICSEPLPYPYKSILAIVNLTEHFDLHWCMLWKW